MKSDWLSQLAPGHAPPAPGWWPPAPGWWVVSLLCILAVATFVWWLRQPLRLPRRAALRQLRVIRASDADGATVARAVQTVVRRYALIVFGRDRVARLTGEGWLNFVIDAGGGAWAGAPGRSMLAAAFGNQTTADDREHWIAGAEDFIKRARASSRASYARLSPPTSQPARGVE